MSTVALFVALGGGAYALSGIPDRSGTFHGCVSNRTGVLRVVRSASTCQRPKGHGSRRDSGEFAISWNQQGRPGVNGLQGSAGQPGPKGDTGPSDAYEGKQSGGFVAIGSNASTALASVSVPSGAYVVQGSAWIMTATINGNPDQAICSAFSADNHGVNGRSQFTVPPVGQFTNANHHEFFGTLTTTGGTVTLRCSAFPVSLADPADDVQAAFGDLVLIHVGSLTTSP